MKKKIKTSFVLPAQERTCVMVKKKKIWGNVMNKNVKISFISLTRINLWGCV